jgi:cysteine desulfurase
MDLVMALDDVGVSVSGGSACQTSAREPSHVLKAIGVSRQRAEGALRVSLGRHTTSADIEQAIVLISRILSQVDATGRVFC